MVEQGLFLLLVWYITKQQLNNEALALVEMYKEKDFLQKYDVLHSLNF